ncbi:MAG: 50S ribosomal protein L15 [Acidimicrobiia bacterium]|nr:50S ribosomal protein L15 [Acidimicrobiia bacterium]MYC58324.1 50S ribosomal protein L15 [Acidimicrobiia bacterium]MYG93499.1 50S ribosomal protein L15 [Acidimicrobiia bacterium]MYI29969.1 50S ribosomal protein L15 [Acidimicrobiia bacterium]
MKLHDLTPVPGSRKQPQRKARGIAGKGGKTAGRGSKGQRARSKIPVGFEGGQMPLNRRIPKLGGFKNPFRVEYQAINLDVIEATELTEITPEVLHQRGLLHKGALAKVLGRGELNRSVTVKAHAFSESAKAAIVAAGGSVEVLPKPFSGRPPAKGNALTNR